LRRVIKTRIGEMAGRVWKILGERDGVESQSFPNFEEKGEIVTKLWLAGQRRKNRFPPEARKTFVFLSPRNVNIQEVSLGYNLWMR